MFEVVTVRDGTEERELDQGFTSRSERKALRQLIVRGIPLKEMHLRPTSRISSARRRGVRGGVREGRVGWGVREEEVEWRWEREEGELSVKVVAACGQGGRVSEKKGNGRGGKRTAMVIQGRSPYLRDLASRERRW